MAGLYNHTTRADGLTLTAAIYNADHQNHIDNYDLDQQDDHSANVAEMQSTVDPGEVGTESLSTDALGEIQRLRFIIQQLTGGAQWYSSPEIPASKVAVEMYT
tara:strand:+ start:248 stop:556 length:309 start_codon:yes stop_codon:yes gene_type:complete